MGACYVQTIRERSVLQKGVLSTKQRLSQYLFRILELNIKDTEHFA